MQPWTYRGCCVLCSFRNTSILNICIERPRPCLAISLLSDRRIANSNKFSSTTKGKESRSARKEQVTTGKRRGKASVHRARESEELDATRLYGRIQHVLLAFGRDLRRGHILERGLAEQPHANEANWQSFENGIRSIFDGRPTYGVSKAVSHNTSLSNRLEDAARSTKLGAWKEALKREIQFAYIDHIATKGSSTRTGVGVVADLRFPTEWYPRARQLQRTIHLHVGPTNSGKTYNALKRLEEKGSGFYAGPLRLLAHEVYSRFNNKGIICNLVTGDDIRVNKELNETKLYSSTIEMVDIGQEAEVGVIDEIQMMGDPERGWAWTRALLGARAKELHLCGETRVVPLVRELVATMGDTLHIHQYDRLNPLKVMSRSLRGNLQNLRKGDAVVSFSIMSIHALKQQIELETGRRCAIVYGSLPPETRARQAALFNDPDNDYDYLVASNAIGMGLNLAIKRIIFHSTIRWNGSAHEPLSVPDIKQIAGRAGRFRTAHPQKRSQPTGTSPDVEAVSNTAGESTNTQVKRPVNIGLVTCLDEADLPFVRRALETEAPPLRRAGLLPPNEVYEEFAAKMPPGTPFEYIMQRVNESASTTDSRFSLCSMKDQLDIAQVLDRIPNLQLWERLQFCASPAQVGRGLYAKEQEDILVAFATAVETNKPITVADVPEIPLEILDQPLSGRKDYLQRLELLHKTLILFLWLSYRFSYIFEDQRMAFRAKELVEDKINTCLVSFSANPQLRERILQIKKSSAVLREQAGRYGERLSGSRWLNVKNFEATINPDASVGKVESMTANIAAEWSETIAAEDEQLHGGIEPSMAGPRPHDETPEQGVASDSTSDPDAQSTQQIHHSHFRQAVAPEKLDQKPNSEEPDITPMEETIIEDEIEGSRAGAGSGGV